jgi:BASS family bile acid:Na+ symporter
MNNVSTKAQSRLGHFIRLYGRTLALGLAIGVGALLPQAHVLSFLIQYLLVIMLFLSFLDMPISRRSFHRSIGWVLLANLAIPFLAYFLLRPINADLALIAFMCGITPTAIAAPVIMSFLEGHVDYMATSVLLTNVVIALVVPFALPIVVGTRLEVSSWEVLRSVLLVVFTPLILARAFAYLPQKVQVTARKAKPFSFPLWIAVLFIVSSKATYSLTHDVSVSTAMLIEIAAVSLAVCAINFGIGALLGGKEYYREASQSLGQKNNSFTIWLALTFVSPLAALGPTFYVVYHNIYNSFQLYDFERKRMGRKI